MESLPWFHLGVLSFILGISFFFYTYPPKRINWLNGYRTPTAMQNQQTWDFANRYSAKWMLRLVLINTGLGIAAMLVLDQAAFTAAMKYLVPLLVGSLFAVIAATEWALYHRFKKAQS